MSSRSIWLHGRRGSHTRRPSGSMAAVGTPADSVRDRDAEESQCQRLAMALANMPRRGLSLSKCGFDSGSSDEQG
jgi:hypothetical protein